MKSKFTGGLLGLIGVSVLQGVIIICTFGVLLPYAIVIKQKWIVKHTIIDGKQLVFNGTGIGLFGTWIKIWLLCLITLGIYGFWANLAIKKWIVKNTHFIEIK